jgi:hypothetical protein
MVTAAQVRRIALALANANDESASNRLVFSVGGRGFAWTFLERPAPKAARQPRLDVLAVCCTLDRKDMLIEAAPDIYFDDDHYKGFPAVLVRLDAIDKSELAALLEAAWRLQAAKRPKKSSAKKAPKAAKKLRT